MSNLFRALLLSILFFGSVFMVMAERPNPVASRIVDGEVLYYHSLHEAVESVLANEGASINEPDEITLLADITAHAPIVIEDNKHIRLVAGEGDRTIMRGSDLLDYPVIWVSGENASLTLGKPPTESSGMEWELIIDGGFLTASEGSQTPVIANTPLVVVNGPDSKLIMYDNVSLQNNNNSGRPIDTSIFENGAGVFIRTAGDQMDRLAEFIMKGGVIQGNVNNAQGEIASGGGVLLAGFGLFTMEGGVIKNNTARHAGGGFHLGGRASLQKTGGVVYGIKAPEGMRNIAIEGSGQPLVFGHAVSVSRQYRNNTVGENDNLSYFGKPMGNGDFGVGEKWDNPKKDLQRKLIIIIPIVLLLGTFSFIVILKKAKQKKSNENEIDVSKINLSDAEKKVFDLLLTDDSIKVIADKLQITYDGVIFHSRNIYRKLGVKNRTELLVKYSKK